MSQWDFGYGREPTEHHEPPYPQQPPYPYSEQQEQEYPYAQEAQDPQYAYPQEPQYQYPEAPQYPQDAGWPGAAGQPGDAGWSYGAGQPAEAAWSVDTGWPDADGYPAASQPYDPPDAYPITYERDAFDGRAALPAVPAPGAAPPYSPWPDAADPGDRFGTQPSENQWRPPPPAGREGSADRTQVLYPGRRRPYPAGPAYGGPRRPGDPRTQPAAGWRPDGGTWPPGDEGEWEDDGSGRGRWLIPIGLAVAGAAVGAAIVMFALGHHRPAAGTGPPATGTGSSAGPSAGAESATTGDGPAPLTLAAAKSVLSNYTTANNSANARRSDATLATVETGGSYAIDAGLYTAQAADGAAPYPAFTPVATTYYIPQGESAGGTHWFVVQVSNAFSANPQKVTSTEYLLFSQPSSGGPWQNAVEPYLLAGANARQVAVGGNGLATAVSATATFLAVPPGQLAERTATSIDGTGNGVTVADPGALADRAAQTFWHGKLPTATVTDAHAAATGTTGQTFALLTTDGGALVFYTDAAEVAITPPAGSAIHLTVPGLYSPGQALSRAGLSYLDQFAADDPPTGQGTPRVVAGYSGITGKN